MGLSVSDWLFFEGHTEADFAHIGLDVLDNTLDRIPWLGLFARSDF